MGDFERVVDVVAYDPAWPERFEIERRLLADALPMSLSIEHIGSTSVPGLAAKPIIDILVVVPDVEGVAADVSALERHRYRFRPSAFADDHDHLFFPKDTAGRRTHHLHVFGTQSPQPRENRIFREYLKVHPEVARRYEVAKHRAAALHPDSRAEYGAAKEPFVIELMAEALLWDETSGRTTSDG
ncbi:GrpB family protein [Streptomyces sp. NPDC051954]|uniref:GrpB family protein n=1 Tax=unclassified Streptomyces TaxID=2593676 RepID=UPI00341299C2